MATPIAMPSPTRLFFDSGSDAISIHSRSDSLSSVDHKFHKLRKGATHTTTADQLTGDRQCDSQLQAPARPFQLSADEVAHEVEVSRRDVLSAG
jgi:hypothetical protein